MLIYTFRTPNPPTQRADSIPSAQLPSKTLVCGGELTLPAGTKLDSRWICPICIVNQVEQLIGPLFIQVLEDLVLLQSRVSVAELKIGNSKIEVGLGIIGLDADGLLVGCDRLVPTIQMPIQLSSDDDPLNILNLLQVRLPLDV